MRTIYQIIDLIKELEGIDSDYALAALLKIPKQTIHAWKKRNTIPYDVLISYCRDRNYSLDWFLYDIGPMYKIVSDHTIEYLSKRNQELENECKKLRSIVKKIGDDISEVSHGSVPDAGVVPDTP